MKRLAIISARGGSKRIPRKNIRPFCGRPIIHYPIRAAVDSGLFDEVMVSTDDNEIAEVAKAAGATFPFRRSAATANDHATLTDVLIEVIGMCATRGMEPDAVCLLLPTAPFVTAAVLVESFTRFQDAGAPALIPVARFSFPILRALKMSTNGEVAMMWPEHATTRSQDLPAAFHDAGQFYWMRPGPLRQHGSVWMPGVVGMELPGNAVQDIDTEDDWNVAEAKWLALRGIKSGGGDHDR